MGGLVTFTDSGWLMSVVLANQPHFIGQPEDVQVFWGCGLFIDHLGNYVNKKTSDCTGRSYCVSSWDICDSTNTRRRLSHIELHSVHDAVHHEPVHAETGKRPIIGATLHTTNIAFVGQCCEIPEGLVFTVEYSVRSAQTAVYAVLGIDEPASPIFEGEHDPAILSAPR